jgi:hypothetical protein
MLRDGPINGEYDAAPVTSESGSGLPLVAIAGFAASPGQAKIIAQRATHAFLLYLRREQDLNAIPAASRVKVEVVERPGVPFLVEGRRLTRPIFLFVLVVTATFILAFALENLRPRLPKPAPAASDAGLAPAPLQDAARKTA